MSYRIEPAFAVASGLSRKLVLAGMSADNQWFFSDGAFSEDGIIQHRPDTWTNEDFVVLDEEGIIAFFNATWSRPLDIISSFRLILFEKSKSQFMVKAFFEYLEYIFVKRGCNAFNWSVAEQNKHALQLYEKFINRYMGHKIGKRHSAQKSYSGIISDIFLYEITREEYLDWKKRKF